MGLAFPGGHLAEGQFDDGLGVFMHMHDPGVDVCGVDAELFIQFAHQGLFDGFAGLNLAAGEFPPAGPGLAFGALA